MQDLNITNYDEAIASLHPIEKSVGFVNGIYTDFSDLATNVSGRPGLTRNDYESFRKKESLPKTVKQSILMSDKAYKDVGLIRNTVDLMSDFAFQGIKLVHKSKRVEKFYENWFKKVNGAERSERLLNYIYRLGNYVCRKRVGKINKTKKKKLFKTFAAEDIKIEFENITANEIPISYTFYHPGFVDCVGGDATTLSPKREYSITIPSRIKRVILHPKTTKEKEIVEQLPNEIKEAAKKRGSVILPSDKIRVGHYKKDDWDTWAWPLIHAIFKDIILYDKLKLADMSALDGAISNIRIFKLGSLEHKIIPNRAAFNKLAEILESHTGVGTMDFVWGPDIDLLESQTDVHNFLGEDKYKPTLLALYAGLGIPPTLTGTFGNTGTTNNFISLKVLTKRLSYGRDLLKEFWEKEIKIVQEAMGFQAPAKIEFGIIDLEDEAAQKQLLIQLADRELISDELLMRHFGHDEELEQIRIKKENKKRDKVGPYHNENDDGEKGRPQNSSDKNPRKNKEFKPKLKAMKLWVSDAQKQIADIVNPYILQSFGKKNMRSLSASQTKQSEQTKFNILFNLEPFCEINNDSIKSVLSQTCNANLKKEYNSRLNLLSQEIDRKLTFDEIKDVQCELYVEINS